MSNWTEREKISSSWSFEFLSRNLIIFFCHVETWLTDIFIELPKAGRGFESLRQGFQLEFRHGRRHDEIQSSSVASGTRPCTGTDDGDTDVGDDDDDDVSLCSDVQSSVRRCRPFSWGWLNITLLNHFWTYYKCFLANCYPTRWIPCLVKISVKAKDLGIVSIVLGMTVTPTLEKWLLKYETLHNKSCPLSPYY